MIRGRDQIRLSLQKVGLRKKRAAFAIVSVALGAVVVVIVSSLMDGVRDVAVKTLWTEEIDRDVIKVFANHNPYDYVLPDEDRKQKTKKRFQFMTESVLEEIRGWSDVEAADRPVTVRNVGLAEFADRPRPVTQVRGVPLALIRRYVQDTALLDSSTNAVPLVVGERNVRLRYDEKKKKFEFDAAGDLDAWTGRELTLVVGDNYAQLARYQYDYEKREFRRSTDEEMAAQRNGMRRSYEGQYDATIFSSVLSLRGRIVGFCPGNDVLAPLETAALCEKWVNQRNGLARLQPVRETDEPAYEARGRRGPKPGEFIEAIVLVKRGADIESVAQRIEQMGLYAATRARTFENQAKAFDSGFRFVKRIALCFGAVILGLAGGLLWSTTSKIVSDSRADIGLFRALGATKRDIRRLFLGETVLLGLLGTIVGMVLGWGLSWIISHWVVKVVRGEVDLEEALLIPDSIFAINVEFTLFLLAGAAVLSFVAGLPSANRAANVDPVRALKRE